MKERKKTAAQPKTRKLECANALKNRILGAFLAPTGRVWGCSGALTSLAEKPYVPASQWTADASADLACRATLQYEGQRNERG